MKDLSGLVAADFQACAGDEMALRTADGDVPVVLRKVDVKGPGWDRPEAFSVEFVGPASTPLGQGVYGIVHPKLPEVGILVVPVGRDDEGLQYEAIFN